MAGNGKGPKFIITAERFPEEIRNILEDYEKDCRELVEKAAKKAARDAVKDLKANSPSRHGDYAGSWQTTTTKNELNEYTLVVRNKDHYQLTHLLEHSHVTPKGNYTTPIPHIKPAEEKANEQFYNDVVKGIKEGLNLS